MSRVSEWWQNSDWSNIPDWDGTDDFDYDTQCTHLWVPITLVYSVVYDCKYCGKKQEDLGEFDKSNKSKD